MTHFRFQTASTALALTVLAATAGAQTSLVSESLTGGAANNVCYWLDLTPDGRHAAFCSIASDLVPNDTNVRMDVFVRDLVAGTTVRVSVASSGAEGDGTCFGPSISADGRFIAFESYSTNLVPGDTNGASDVFLHDRVLGTTERVSVTPAGAQLAGGASFARLSADGRFVGFFALDEALPGSSNGWGDAFVKDMQTGAVERISLGLSGQQADGISLPSGLSADGRFVAFTSQADNLFPADTNASTDVFVRDRLLQTTELVNLTFNGNPAEGASDQASISADGRYVSFRSFAENIVADDMNETTDIFLRDRQAGVTERVVLGFEGDETDGFSQNARLSSDGRHLSFSSYASNLVPDAWNGFEEVYALDIVTGFVRRVSVSQSGSAPDHVSTLSAPSEDGRAVLFQSDASNLVLNDGDIYADVFLRDERVGSEYCFGDGSGTACPCGNQGDAGHGCQNSVTLGARLDGVGSASVSADDLVFQGSWLVPGQPVLLFAGINATNGGAGQSFGDGLRCAGGAVVRLGTTTPDAEGEARWGPGLAAQAGWSAGDLRRFQGWYRDPLGLCGSGFNLSNGVEVQFAP